MNNGANSGLFAFNVNNAPSNSNWNVGASLSYSGLLNYNARILPHFYEGKISCRKHGLVRETIMSMRL